MSYKIPGVFVEETRTIDPIKISQKCVVGFIGITERGPYNKPVRITSYGQFKKTFGNFISYGYLPLSIFGFFNSGGKECVIVRVAHIDDENDVNSAQRASIAVNDINKKPLFNITALSEGIWGNSIEVKIEHNFVNTLLCENVSNSSEVSVQVDNSEDFFEGEVVCLTYQNTREYKKIQKVEENKLYFAKKIKSYEEGNIYCSKILLNFHFINGREVESYQSLSQDLKSENYFMKKINAKSNLVRIHKKGSDSIPLELFYSYLSGGKNGILSLTPADFIGNFKGLDDNRGLGIFESIDDISLIVAPDVLAFEDFIHTEKETSRKDIFTVQRAMIDQCEKMGNRFAILDTPDISDIIELVKWREKFDSKLCAMYHSRIEIFDPSDQVGVSTVYLPPSGHVAGIYALCDKEDGIFRPPANKFIKGGVSVKDNVNNMEYEIIYPMGINILRNVPGRGVKIWGARTLASDSDWVYINVVRTFAKIKEALKNGSGWAVFEPNTMQLRKHLVRHVSAFLLDLWYKGYLMGKVPEEGFYVRCDDELNPPEEIDAGKITVEVGVAIVKPAEFLVIQIKKDTENNLNAIDE
jgi:uncharacterized protein